jgi:aromatic ring-opening dioxygenase catalytic subunit (LigB family)
MTGEFRRNFDRLEQSLTEMRAELGNAPKAVLVISGHWEGEGFAISSGAKPGMVYDYSGFAEYLYHITYGAPGSPELARRVQELLRTGGIEAQLDPTRGFDHGTFSIMKPLYPEEDLPLVQLSLDAGYDPALHLAVGRALAPLRDEGVLIIGSGLSYHNLQEIRALADTSHPAGSTIGFRRRLSTRRQMRAQKDCSRGSRPPPRVPRTRAKTISSL